MLTEPTTGILAHSSYGESYSNESLEKIHEKDTVSNPPKHSMNSNNVPIQYYWDRVIKWTIYHLIAVYGLYLAITSAKWQTNVLAFLLYNAANIGITAGAHRLWSHHSYKARLPLRIFLLILLSIAFQLKIYTWVRQHRLHHKYSDTHADPHNANRGFFYAHLGHSMSRRHPEVIEKIKLVDLRDIEEDPVVRFERKYYFRLAFLFCYLLPTILPMYLWNETFINSFFVTIFRHCVALHATFLINSAAHLYGYRPYDVNINPRENMLVSLSVAGEGFHNYHHAFPYDYAASEYGTKLNLATAFINLMAFLGLAYDLKTASSSTIQDRKLRTGFESLKNMEEKNGSLSYKSD